MRTSEWLQEVRLVGEHGTLIDVSDPGVIPALDHWLRDRFGSLLDEVIPGGRTVMVLSSTAARRAIQHELENAQLRPAASAAPRTVVIDVCYDGRDLPAVAEQTGLSVREVVRRHSEVEYRVDFFGFSPGQAFFNGVPDGLRVPRRTVPRTRVPDGSLAIANEYTVIYPPKAPGGWNLIGRRVGPPLWNSEAVPPNMVSVGDRVVFVEKP